MARDHDIVPAHVGQTDSSFRSGARDSDDPAFDPSQARQFPFLARVRHHLHADADTKHGDLLLEDELLDRGAKARLVKQHHRMIEGPDTGENELRDADQVLHPRTTLVGWCNRLYMFTKARIFPSP